MDVFHFSFPTGHVPRLALGLRELSARLSRLLAVPQHRPWTFGRPSHMPRGHVSHLFHFEEEDSFTFIPMLAMVPSPGDEVLFDRGKGDE